MGDGEISATGREALYSETEREKIHTLIKRYCGSGKRAEFTRLERFGKGELGELVCQGKNMEQASSNLETSPKTSQAARAPPAITRSRKGTDRHRSSPAARHRVPHGGMPASRFQQRCLAPTGLQEETAARGASFSTSSSGSQSLAASQTATNEQEPRLQGAALPRYPLCPLRVWCSSDHSRSTSQKACMSAPPYLVPQKYQLSSLHRICDPLIRVRES